MTAYQAPAVPARPRVLARTKGMSREEWLAARRAGLGGSDIAALTRGKLWAVYAAKLGLADPSPETDAMRRGHGLEAFLRGEVAHRHPAWRITQRHAILQHPTEDWALGNVDGLIRDGDSTAILEIKTSRQSWPEGVPEDYQAQVQWYLAITGAPRAVVAVMFGDFTQAEYTLVADRTTQAALMQLGRAFWRRVVDRVPPPLDGSDAARSWLLAQYPPRPDRPQPVAFDAETAGLVELYRDAQAIVQHRKAAMDTLGAQLRAAIGDAPGGLTDTHRVSWVRSTAKHVDLDGLRRDHPDLIAAYTTERPRDGGLRLSERSD